MRIRFRRTLALLLSLMLLAMISPAALADDNSEENTGSVSQTSTATVNLSPGANAVTAVLSDNSFKTDLKEVPLTVELYQVAPAVAVEGYDTYAFDLNAMAGGPFQTLRQSLEAEFNKDGKSEDSETSEEGASEAPKGPDFVAYMNNTLVPFLLSDEFEGRPVATGEMTNGEAVTVTGLDPGLYVLVVHGDVKDENGADDYIRGLNERGKLAGKDETPVQKVTVAESRDYTYIFTPQLLSLPTRTGGSATEVRTSDSGEWTNSIEVVLKTERESRNGSLEIVKTLNGYVGTDPAVFIFDVEATLDGRNVYSDVVTLVFTDNGTKRVTLERKIPAGATVTVEEVYSGSRYVQTGGPDYSIGGQAADPVIEIDRLLSVSFTNTHDGTVPGGGSIVNRFTAGQNGSWQLSNPADSTVASTTAASEADSGAEGGDAS